MMRYRADRCRFTSMYCVLGGLISSRYAEIQPATASPQILFFIQNLAAPKRIVELGGRQVGMTKRSDSFAASVKRRPIGWDSPNNSSLSGCSLNLANIFIGIRSQSQTSFKISSLLPLALRLRNDWYVLTSLIPSAVR